MNLSQISRTPILTLVVRVIVSEKKKALVDDPMAALCLERLIAPGSDGYRHLIMREKRIFGGTQMTLTRTGGVI